MAEAQSSGDLQRAQVRNLATAVPTLLERAAAAPAGRTALTLVPGGGLRSSRRCWRSGGRAAGRTQRSMGQRRCRSCRAECGR